MGERKNVVFPFKAFSFSKRKAELFFTKWERKAELFSKRKAELFFTRAFVYLLSFFQSPEGMKLFCPSLFCPSYVFKKA
jgi:hypothetical protein